MILETRKRVYYTTARTIHKDETEDWLWVNPNQSFRFVTYEGAQNIANLSNDNGRDSGLNINDYPYFVVKVSETSVIEEVSNA